MKRNKNIIWVIAIISIIIIALPFFLDSFVNQDISVSASIISALSSLATMIIAILLFDKYGIKKSRVEKQSETIIQFFKIIKDLSFWMHSNISFLQYKPDSNLEAVYEFSYKTRLYFDDTYIKTISDLSDFGYDINMPRSVANKIKILKPYSMIPIEKKDVPDHCFIVTMHSLGKKNIIDKVFSRINDKDLTFFDYHNLWIEIIDEAKNWLSKNDIDINDLNIN